MVFVDCSYKFVYGDVGFQGRISDGGVSRNTSFYKALENGQLSLSDPTPLPLNRHWNWEQDSTLVSFVFIGDYAFPLTTYCIKPYSQRNLTDEQIIFNFRASHYRRVSENDFGILANQFRLFWNISQSISFVFISLPFNSRKCSIGHFNSTFSS